MKQCRYLYHWTERLTGLSLAVVGLGSMLVSGVLVGPLVARLGERGTLIAGLTFGALGFAFYGLAGQSALFFAGIPLTALWGLASPPIQSLMSRELETSQQGQLQGALGSMRGITGMIGPLLFTQVFARALAAAPGRQLPGAPYLLAAVLVALSLIVAWAVSARRRRPASP